MNDTNEVRMTLRLPVAIRDRLIQTAEMNNRSMNGEIVERLDYSLYRLNDDFQKVIDDTHRDDKLRFEAEKKALEDDLSRAKRQIDELEESLVRDRSALRELINNNAYLEDLRRTLEKRLNKAEENDFSYVTVPEDQTIYVLLDANGFPISWQEISLHLGEISRQGNFQIDKIEARIFDATVKSNNEREEDFFRLYEKYRALRAEAKDGATDVNS